MSRTVVNEPSGTVSPLRVAHADLQHVARCRARYWPSACASDAEGAAEQVEVVDVGRAEIDLQRGEHVRHVDAEQLRLGAVDVEIELRRRGLEQREHLLQARRLRRARPSWRRSALCKRLRAARRRGPRPSCGSRRHCRCRAPAAAAPTKTSASWIAASLPNSCALDRRRRLARIAARAPRTASSTRKIAPAFGALVKVAPEKPTMFTACATPGIFSAMSTARRLTASVRASEAPGGSCVDDDQIAAVELRDEADRRLAEFVEAEGEDAGIDAPASARRSARRAPASQP